MVGGGRLPEVHPADVDAGVEPLHARHTQHRGRGRPRGRDPEVRAVAERGGLGPEVGPAVRGGGGGGRGGLSGAGVVAERKRFALLKRFWLVFLC